MFRNLLMANAAKPYMRRLEYIESTGTQYIDTGIAIDLTDKISGKFVNTATPAWGTFWARRSLQDSERCYLQWSNFGRYYYVFGTGGAINTSSGEFTVDFAAGTFICGGETKSISLTATNEYPVILCASSSRDTGEIRGFSQGKIYYWKHYRNGVLIQDLIPVLDLNGKPKMFDLVSGKYPDHFGEFLHA